MNNNKNVASAACFLFAPNGKQEMCILCGRRSGHERRFNGGCFDVPVGRIENGESPIQAAVRELQEEAGMSISPSILNFHDYQPWNDGTSRCGANYYAFLDKQIKIGNGDFEHDFFKWLPLTEIGKYHWAFEMDKKIMEIYHSNNHLNEQRIQRIINEEIHKLLS